MTDDLPLPLVPADVDLRDLDGFMLNVERLLASELWALTASQPEAFRAAVGLWARAWKQVPGASLPSDETTLAAFAGMPLARLKRQWALVMRGFVLCNDGRYYHRVLAPEAVRAWERKKAFRLKREADQQRLKRWRSERKVSGPEWENLREEVFTRDGYRCTKCPATDDLHCDHIIALSRGGTNDVTNLTTLCGACHSHKTANDKRRDRHIGSDGELSGEMHFTEGRSSDDMHFVAEGQGQGQGQEDSFSEPIGSAGLRAVDPAKRVFDLGKEWLGRYGFKPSKAGGLITQWRREVSNDAELMTMLLDAGSAERSDPIAYMGGCIRARKGRGDILAETDDLYRRLGVQ
jgi:hypothetical protein